MKKLLMVTFYWPPFIASGVWRPLKFSKYLPGCGWTPTVVTSANWDDPSAGVSAVQPPVDIEVHRVKPCGDWQLARAVSWLAWPVLWGARKSRAWLEEKMVARTTKWLKFPSPARATNRWLLPMARHVVKLARGGGYSAIYVTASPNVLAMSAIVISYFTRLPIVLEFRDPWTQNFAYTYRGLRDWLCRRIERWSLRRAAAVVVVTPGQLELLKERYPESAGKMVCITNGFDHEDLPPRWKDPSREKFVVSVLGMTYDDPEPLFAAIRSAAEGDNDFKRQFVFRWIGCDEKAHQLARQYGLDGNMELLGPLPQRQALAQASQSHALWLEVPVAEGADYIIRGKTFEYLALGLPILGTAPAEACTRQIVEPACALDLISTREPAEMAALLGEAFGRWKKGTLAGRADESYVAPFRRDNLSKRLAQVLDGVAAAAGN